MSTDEIRPQLFPLQDAEYRDFMARLLPMIDREAVIGIRTPALRKLAKELFREPGIDEFLSDLPHLPPGIRRLSAVETTRNEVPDTINSGTRCLAP